MNGRTWTLRGMAGAVVLLCAARGALAQKTDKADSKPAAIVNGETISMGELEVAVQKSGPPPMPQPEAVRNQQRQMVLHSLIDAVLIRQFLQKNAPPVDGRAVNAKMGELVAGLHRQGKSLAEFCRDLNQSEGQLRENVAAILQWNLYARQHVDERQVEQYYRENKDLFDHVKVRISEIMLRLPAQSTLGDKEKARKQLVDLRAELVANKIDFAEAAKKYSQGPTKDQGGDLEEWPHIRHLGMLPDNLLDTAFALQPGQISDVIETEYGFHLIKITDRKVGVQSEFAKVKDDARDLCLEEMKQVLLTQLRQQAEIKILLP